jgi:TPR repeat protein
LKLTQLLQSDPDKLYQQALELRQEKAGELSLQAAHRMFAVASLMGMYAARYHLGLMNLRGEARERSRVRALMWFRLAGSRDDPRAARQAAELASDLKPVEIRQAMRYANRFEEAEAKFRIAKRGEDADAITAMGAMFMQGDGVDRDATLAVEWLMRAVEKNHADAQWRLGLAYAHGDGVTKNTAEASRLLQLSVSQANCDAQYHWAQLLEHQSNKAEVRAKAMGLYESAAQQGHMPAQLHLAYALRAGEAMYGPGHDPNAVPIPRKTVRRSTAPHLVRSLNFFRMAADKGHAAAQFELGQMYAQGLGVAQQFEEAAFWYLLAAKQGHAQAQFHLGFLHSHGQGVEQDYMKAYQWYCVSERCGYALAKKNVAYIGKKLSPGEREMAQWRAESFVFAVQENHHDRRH